MNRELWMAHAESAAVHCEPRRIINLACGRLCRTVPNRGRRLASAQCAKTPRCGLDLTPMGRSKISLRFVSGE